MATLFGDTSGTLSGNTKAKNQLLNGKPNEDKTLFGDASAISTDDRYLPFGSW